ncbi:MAG: PepSY-like domain-containing protein [Bacteroidia bacterium]
MKNLSFKSILVIFSFTLLFASCKWVDDVDMYRRVKVEDLPSTIIEYVDLNYPNATIQRAWRDNDGYEIRLSNGREINFDLDGIMIYEEDDYYDSVSLNNLPPAISQYLSSNYPGTPLIAVFMDDDEYKVLLASGHEVYFSKNGSFLRVESNPGYTLVPANQLPAPVTAYLSAQYPGLSVVAVWMDDDGYEVFLSNGIELNFSLDGTFLYAG